MALVKPFFRSLPFGFQRPLTPENETSNSKSLNIERSAVRAAGGIPNMRLDGPDGRTSGILSRPIEVKEASVSGRTARYRVGEQNHRLMLEQNGIYIFVAPNGARRQMSAREADSLIRFGWLKDERSNGQNYSHSFIFVDDVFR